MDLNQTWELLTRKLTGWGRAFILGLPNFLLAVATVVGFWLLARAARNVVMRVLRRVSHSEQVNYLLSQIVYVAILVAGTFSALGILGLQKTVASLLAGAGIVTLALGFAFQDIAANLLAGIYLAVRRPFRRGHLVKTQDYFGIVQEVNLRWTEILTQQGQVVLIPNKQVFENPIMNYSVRGTRRVDITLGVSYGDDLEKAKRIAIEAVSALPTILPGREVELFYEDFEDSSIDFTIRFWISFEQQKDYLAARSDAIIRIKKAFDAAGIALPFPTRTLDFAVKGGETLAEVLEEVEAGRR
ncbi:MAG TPA: mechanosensitive ion channel family protein [Thermoanaerobaculia bacterium]|nr:mechanosensitive ion channel family protein [Thermoanaerobaculia bacterium]